MSIRLIQDSDFPQLYKLLGQLSDMGDWFNSELVFKRSVVGSTSNLVYIYEENGKIVGTGTLVIFSCYSHGGSFRGRIEDVVVDRKYRKMGIGNKLCQHLIELAKEFGLYKVELSCIKENVPFYQKLGFKEHESSMRLDL